MSRPDWLLTHGYHVWEDPHELATMRPYPPLGILYLAAWLRRAGVGVSVFDSTFERRDRFERVLLAERPKRVGIYANMMTRVSALRMIATCKRHDIEVVLGGPDPAGYPAEYLRAGADVVVIGEGERTIEELTGRLIPNELADVPGIAFLREGELVRTVPRAQIAKLDDIPWPARDLIDIDAYVDTWRRHHGLGSVSLITARGCPFHCRWCSHAVYGHSHRRRSVTDVADEVEHILATYRPDMVWYADDVFTIHKKWFKSYALELQRRGIRVPFETITREDRLDESIVEALADMGCRRIWVGAESGSQRLLDKMDRSTDAERVIEMVHLLQRHGIEAGMFIMLGYDDERHSDLRETVRVLSEAAPDTFLTTVSYPIMGTGYHADVKDRVIARRAWAEGSDRDLTVAGRHSPRYYEHATRWMVAEVGWRTALKRGGLGGVNGAKIGRQVANAALGRLGMWRTRHEREGGVEAPRG